MLDSSEIIMFRPFGSAIDERAMILSDSTVHKDCYENSGLKIRAEELLQISGDRITVQDVADFDPEFAQFLRRRLQWFGVTEEKWDATSHLSIEQALINLGINKSEWDSYRSTRAE